MNYCRNYTRHKNSTNIKLKENSERNFVKHYKDIDFVHTYNIDKDDVNSFREISYNNFKDNPIEILMNMGEISNAKKIKGKQKIKDSADAVSQEYIHKHYDYKPNVINYGREVEVYFWDARVPFKLERPTFRIPSLHKRNSTNIRWTRMALSLVEYLQYIRRKDLNGATILNIPTTYTKFTKLLGNQMNVSKAIDVLVNMGVLSRYDERYIYISDRTEKPHLTNTFAKTYLYHYGNELLLLDWCKVHNITAWTEQENYNFVDEDEIYNCADVEEDWEIQLADVSICQHLNLKRPNDESKEHFENRVLKVLFKKYPQLKDNYNMMKEFNKRVKNPLLECSATPKITWNKDETKIVSIGYRIHCPLCEIPKTASQESLHKYGFYNRKDALKHFNLTQSENDVKSSVPRTAFFLAEGYYLSQDVDCYKEIFDLAHSITEEDNPFKDMEWCEEVRNAIKTLFMRADFSKSYKTANQSFMYHTYNTKNRNEYYTDECLNATLHISENIFKYLRKAIVAYTNSHSTTSEIFMHESSIMMRVALKLSRKGHKVFMCYDGFYTDKKLSETDFRNLVEECAYEYQRKYYQFFDNLNTKNMYSDANYSATMLSQIKGIGFDINSAKKLSKSDYINTLEKYLGSLNSAIYLTKDIVSNAFKKYDLESQLNSLFNISDYISYITTTNTKFIYYKNNIYLNSLIMIYQQLERYNSSKKFIMYNYIEILLKRLNKLTINKQKLRDVEKILIKGLDYMLIADIIINELKLLKMGI